MKFDFRFKRPLTKECGNYKVPDKVGNDVCLDLGACIGAFTSKHVKRFKRIYCFEATHDAYCHLISNIANEKLRNCFAFNFAVGKTSGNIIPMYIKKHNTSIQAAVSNKNTLNAWNKGGAGCQGYMNALTISWEDTLKFLNLDYVNYIKCDVEGSEYDYFMGKDLSQVDCISIELHHVLGKKRDDLRDHFLKYFNEIAFRETTPKKKATNWEATYLRKSLD